MNILAWSNIVYGASCGVLLIVLIFLAYLVVDKTILRKFLVSEKIQEGNIAVAIVVAGTFLSLGIALGLVLSISLIGS